MAKNFTRFHLARHGFASRIPTLLALRAVTDNPKRKGHMHVSVLESVEHNSHRETVER